MKVARHEKVGDQYQKEMADLIQKELKDPNLPMLTTVTAVEVSSDLSHATFYISVFGQAEEKKKALQALERAKGFLRKELAGRVRLRITPELHFKLDESLEYGLSMSKLIQETLKKDEEQRCKDPALMSKETYGAEEE